MKTISTKSAELVTGRTSVEIKTTSKGEVYFDLKYYLEDGESFTDAANKLRKGFLVLDLTFPNSLLADYVKKNMK